MPNWHESMQQTFEYRRVDPISWLDREQITTVTESTINRDGTTETLVSATLNLTEAIEECYIRIYLVTLQNGITERFPLATVLVQTPDKSFDGKITTISLDAYSPLTELKENQPPLGYSLGKGENVMDSAYKLCRENMRAPVIQTSMVDTLQSSFVANSDDTWLTYNKDLIATVDYTFDLDEMGQLLFAPNQEAISLQPVTTFDDSNSSILYPDITINRDMYGIPNVVEVIYSSGRSTYYAIQIYNGEDSVASFGEYVLLGKTDNVHIIISKSGLKAYGDATADPIEEITWGLFTDFDGNLISAAHYGFGMLLSDPVNGFGSYSLVEGIRCEAGGIASHAEGYETIVTAGCSHAEGYRTVVNGHSSHAEGNQCRVTLNDDGNDVFSAHAEGHQTTASNNFAHAEGCSTIASGKGSHAEGNNTMATGEYSHAEGVNTGASGDYSHATNVGSIASGYNSTAINGGNASGEGSLAVFPESQAKNTYAAAMGQGAIAGKANQTVIGCYNDPDSNTSALLVVGAGQNANNRRNVFAVGADGSVWSAAGTYNGVDIGNYVYRDGRGSQFNTSTPLLINGNSLGMATAQLILEYNNSYIRFRNDGGSFYIMNGNASSWTNYISFNTGGDVVVPRNLTVTNGGWLYVPSAIKASTTSAANAYISSDSGVLAKTSKTSSRRFKDSITPELDDDLNPEHLYDVDVIQFKYKKDYFTNEDDIRYRKNMIGLIAEDVYDKYKIAADWHVDEDSGEVLVDGWNEQYIIPALLKLIQNQHKELQEQRKEIDQLKETVDILMKDYKERQSK